MREGVERYARYFGKKGWISGEDRERAVTAVRGGGDGEGNEGSAVGSKGVRIVMEAAIAYAVVKALMPLRIVVSLCATPWFARVAVLPLTNLFRRSGNVGAKVSGAGGTGAVEGGVAPKK